MRRKPGTLLPIEQDILTATARLTERSIHGVYGFLMEREMGRSELRSLTGYGTLYRALDRLERAGLLSSEWEDPNIAAAEGRPRRRLYWLTPEGRNRVESGELGQVAHS